MKCSFLTAPNFLAIIPATSRPIAGAEESPGDFVPAILKNPSASSASPMIKSPVSASARRPAKFLILSLKLIFSILLTASLFILSRAESVFPTSSLLSISSAVGPTIKFPCTVCATRIPFPISLGHWNITEFVKFP